MAFLGLELAQVQHFFLREKRVTSLEIRMSKSEFEAIIVHINKLLEVAHASYRIAVSEGFDAEKNINIMYCLHCFMGLFTKENIDTISESLCSKPVLIEIPLGSEISGTEPLYIEYSGEQVVLTAQSPGAMRYWQKLFSLKALPREQYLDT